MIYVLFAVLLIALIVCVVAAAYYLLGTVWNLMRFMAQIPIVIYALARWLWEPKPHPRED